MDVDLQTITQAITGWLTAHGVRILIVLVGAWAVRRFSGVAVENIVRRAIRPDSFSSRQAEKKREDTLIRITQSTIRVLLWVIAGLMIVAELGINVAPLIAAVGVVGIALGFGGQYLIRDVIAGLFIILENQFRVGDVVCFDGTCGLVEDVSLRTTILRDLDGTVHHVPNGAISKTANLSKDFSRINLNVGIAYESDLAEVERVVNEVGKQLAEDPTWKEKITKPPQFLRVDNFGDSAIEIKVLGETQPLAQWDVTGELRKRLKIAFDKAGIDIPYPQRVVHQAKRQIH